MRCLWLVLLASTALFSTADALWREERGVSGSTVETLTNSLKLTDELDEFFKAGKSADDVFKLLALDKADDLLANSKLTDWITYMKAFNRKTPAERTTVIATLTAHYGDDGVAKIVEAAKQVRTTSALAKRVQAEQTQRWLVDGKTPAQVFKLLKLDDAETQLFAQPQIVTWAKYFDDFYKVNPKDETTLFKFLKPRYDQATLAHMLIAAEKVPATKSVATRVQAELTSLWLTDKIEPADIFKLLKLDEVGMSLLKDPIFNAWVKYTDDFRKFHFGTKLTTISVLGKSYQDDVLAKMILSASKHSSTSEIAKRLYTEQRRNWYLSKFAPEHVFKLLRLDQGDIPPLENPLFSTWIKYMVYFSDLRPKEDVSLLTVLGKVYKERDLSQVLVEAYHVPQTKDLATNLLGSQLDRWLVAKRDPVEVFYLLHVEGATAKDVRKLLYNKYRYAFAQLPRDNPVRKLNLLARDALSLVCTATLLVIAESGSKPTDHQIKTRRSEERGANTAPVEALKSSLKTDDWLKAGNSADDVFKLLSLNNAADNLLANPKLSEWITYMKAFDQKNPTKKTTMVATLTTHYGDDELAKIIEAAKQVPSTATMAKRLQSEQIQRWLAQEKSTDKVFSLLKLDNAGDDVFSQPQIQTWVKYVEGFYKTDTNKEAALFSTLASRYSDDVLVQLLIKAKNVPSTKSLATRVQAVQTKLWLSTKKEPGEVFNLLRLDEEGYIILKSPLFTAWIQYTDEFRKLYYGTKLTAVATLTKFFDDEVLTKMILAAMNSPSTANMAKRLEMEQFRNWYIHGYSPKDVFKALNLYHSGLRAFENPLYSVWTKYATYIGAAEPEYKVGLLTNLLTVYGEGNLLKVLRAANKEPSTKKIATEIQDELIKVWVKAQRDPAIYYLLRVDKVGPSDPNRLLYIEYVKAYAMS